LSSDVIRSNLPMRHPLQQYTPRRLPMSAGSGTRDGACGQALNKPEGRKPRSVPMQWESSGVWRSMCRDVQRCCGMRGQAGC
jgi:hypothetical protein